MPDDMTLAWAGLTPPRPGSRKTTCPCCSQSRAKPNERCVTIMSDRAWCWHCQKEWEW